MTSIDTESINNWNMVNKTKSIEYHSTVQKLQSFFFIRENHFSVRPLAAVSKLKNSLEL